MKRRQTAPTEWLILDQPDINPLRDLPRGHGVLLLVRLSAAQERRVRRLSRTRRLTVLRVAPRAAVRVHNLHELTHALLRRSAMTLLSPLYPTRTHPDWKPIPRMRAATLAQLTKRNATALGGMDRKRFAAVAPLGFSGWAGISAFRT